MTADRVVRYLLSKSVYKKQGMHTSRRREMCMLCFVYSYARHDGMGRGGPRASRRLVNRNHEDSCLGNLKVDEDESQDMCIIINLINPMNNKYIIIQYMYLIDDKISV